MGNTLYYEGKPLNYSFTSICDTVTSGAKTWSSQKISDTIDCCNSAWHSAQCVKIGYCSATGTNGVAIGNNAGSYTASYSNTIAIGGTARALGNYGISIGYQAGASFTGVNNTVIGTYALYGASGATGCNNTAIGYNALRNAQGTTNNDNTAIGASALQAMTTGKYNTAIGARALCGLTTGCENFGLGIDAGWKITEGCNNVLIGNNTGMALCGNSSSNVLIGKNVMCAGSVSASYSTIVGAYSGVVNTASNVTFLGYHAGNANTTGCDNTFLGYCTGAVNTTGYDNTYIGFSAGCKITTGCCNVIIGSNSATGFTTCSSNNVIIGNNIGLTNSSEISNAVVIGASANTAVCSGVVSIGHASSANCESSISIGNLSHSYGGINIGSDSSAYTGSVNIGGNGAGLCSVTIGYGAGFSGSSLCCTISIGYRAQSAVVCSISIGSCIYNGFAGGIVIGNNFSTSNSRLYASSIVIGCFSCLASNYDLICNTNNLIYTGSNKSTYAPEIAITAVEPSNAYSINICANDKGFVFYSSSSDYKWTLCCDGHIYFNNTCLI